MVWLLLAGIASAFALRFARRRRRLFTVSASESISTMQIELSKRRTAKTKAALDAATSSLR